jgi:RND superfamily putative drug exporter
VIDALANLTSRRPVRVLVIAAIVSLVCLMLSSGLPMRLATQGFVNPGAESQKALESIADATGYDPSEDIVAIVRSKDQRKLDKVAEKLRLIDGVVAVDARPVVSKDGKSVFISAHTSPGSADHDVAADAVKAFENDEQVKLGGGLVAQHYVSETVSKDLKRSELIAFPLLFLISLFVFRSLFAAALPLLIGAITIPLTMAMIGFYNEITSLSVFALNLTTGLGLGLAIDYSLLSITRYREELAAGAEPQQALRTMMHTAGRTIAFSAVTVAGAILVLGIFPLKFLYSMAFAGATVAIASALVTLTVLPAALILLGPRIDRYSIARKPIDATTARWRRLAIEVMKRPLIVAVAVTLLILVLMMPIKKLSFTSVDASVLPYSNQAHAVQRALKNDFPKANTSTMMIQVDARPTSREAANLRRKVLKVKDVESASQPVYTGLNTWLFNVHTRELYYADSALQAVENIRGLKTSADYNVGGSSADFVDQRDAIIKRVPLALVLILGITFIVLFLMTGSVVLPIKTFVMNLLTLGATFGILTWIFGEGRLENVLGYSSQNALELTQPVLIFVMAFALATDYGVFLLGRIKELRDNGLGDDQSVVEGLARTGRVITSAALLFCIAIGAFSLSGIVFIKELGIGTALAVAIDSTLIRALLVPSLMSMLGEYNWWSPRWLKRLHARIGFSEGPAAPSAVRG